ncbi:Gp138 family membrane-puncturing spike protein [Proteus columbae]|uniref:Gp138 family membrane-puncturing spike protein n=1 Tax=Proteus columbae TaxID=1987580 RepID=UPI00288C5872|nr:Gp138 family membrane-puncturing spike protein [Proteus columbae]
MSKPNNDIASVGSLVGAFSSAFRHLMMNTDDMLPATVINYDEKTNRAMIKPLVMMLTTDDEKISRAPVANIPVFRFGGGGFFIRAPIKPGDFGWLKACDRDISLIFQRDGLEDQPNTTRLHSFSDAMFFPDTIKGWAIDGKNIDALVIQSMDGSVCFSLHNDKVVLETPKYEINAPETIFTGNVTVNGNYAVNGHSDSQGGLMRHNGKDIGSTHTHSGVQAGKDNTGSPI